MGRCLAPCAAMVSPEEYAKNVNDVILFLKGKSSELLDSLKKKMLLASDNQAYEKAAIFRDKITAVETVFDKQRVISSFLENQDIIACYVQGGVAAAQVLIVRTGKMIGEKSFKIRNQGEAGEKEIIASFLKQYYSDKDNPPKQILLPCQIEDNELLMEWLSE